MEPMIQTSAEYHWKTGYDRHRMSGHFLDWENQPNPFKKYAGRQRIPLPPLSPLPEKSPWDLTERFIRQAEPQAIDKNRIAQLLYLTGGITAESRHAGRSFYYRSVASAGALYPAEIYAGIFAGSEIDPGIYHFSVNEFALTSVRSGDFSRYLSGIIDAADRETSPVASFFLTGIFFRSAWKYRARAFRYVLLDTGHLLENLILALTSVGLAYSYHYDFNDEKIARLVGLDDRREAGLVCVNIPSAPSFTAQDPTEKEIPVVDPPPPEVIAAGQVSRREKVYDEILEAWQAGLRKPQSDRVEKPMANDIGVTPADWIAIEPAKTDPEDLSFAEAVRHRRSRRNYIRQPLSRQKFMRLLDLVCRSIYRNGQKGPYDSLSVGILTGSIDGFEPGFYIIEPETKRAGQIITGDFLEPMASVCLDQKWLANAAIHFLFITNLKALDDHYGPRGYRYAMLNAGRLGQLIYLGATALGLGCCGIGALYDSEAQNLLGLNADSALLYLVAAGPIKRHKS